MAEGQQTTGEIRVGEIGVLPLADGYLDIPTERILFPPDRAAALLAAAGRPCPPRLSVNTFLIRSGGRLALIDTGAGDTMGPTAGAQAAALAAAQIDPAAIDTVLLTHIHPDHSNGLRAPSGAARFANAELVVHAADLAFWCEPAQLAAASAEQRPRHEAAVHQIAAYCDRLRPIRAGGEVFPGVTAVPMPGHTPGHTAYLVAAGGAALMIWGDTVHVPAVQVPHPEAAMHFDIDPAMAVAARRRMFDMVTGDGLAVAGMHIDFPGLARLERAGSGYRLAPFVP